MMVKYVHIFHKFVGLEHRRQCWYSVWIHGLWSMQHQIILFLSKLNVSERTCVVRQLMVRHEGKLLKPICVEHGVSTLVAHQGQPVLVVSQVQHRKFPCRVVLLECPLSSAQIWGGTLQPFAGGYGVSLLQATTHTLCPNLAHHFLTRCCHQPPRPPPCHSLIKFLLTGLSSLLAKMSFPSCSGGPHLFPVALSPQRGSHGHNQNPVAKTSCANNCWPPGPIHWDIKWLLIAWSVGL